MSSDYASEQITRVLDAGPEPGERFYRLQVRGAHASNHLNVDAATVAAIRVLIESMAGIDYSEPGECSTCGALYGENGHDAEPCIRP